MKTLDILTLESKFCVGSESRDIALQKLARSICEAVDSYPHFVVVNGFPVVGNRTNLMALSQAISAIDAPSALEQVNSQKEKISFTKVQIDRSKVSPERRVTSYSRTHFALAPHTDSSYKYKPHELIAFQCIVADDQGGASIVIPVENILQRIDHRVAELLRAPVYPFGNGLVPVLFGKSQEHIRYYRAQIDHTIKYENYLLPDEHRAALKNLDTILQSKELAYQFRLQPGQIVFIHNTKALHGRTELSPESDRLLYRVRLQVDSLACADVGVTVGATAVAQSSSNSQKNSAFNSVKDSENQSLTEAQQHIAIAEELEAQYSLSVAFKHYQQAITLAPNEVEILRKFGEFLIHIGKFVIATKIFQRCLAIAPDDYFSNMAMSSIAYQNQDYQQAQEILKQVSQRHPYVLESQPQSHKPTILRFRSFQNSKYGIIQKQDGTYKSLLQGGHFSINDLVERERYNWILLNIFDDSLDRIEEFPQVDLLLNTIACPDSKRTSLLAAARFADRYRDLPIINDPRRVLETTRERNALRLNGISGVTFPKTEKVSWDGVSLAAFTQEIFGLGFVFPFIIRQVGSQTGISVALIDNEQAIENYLHKISKNCDYYIIQYHDCRHNQLFNKTRVFFIDGNFYPVANLFNDSWNTHSGDRYNLMKDTPWTQDAEQSFLNNPISYLGRDNYERLCQIRDLVGLDFFGIDFTMTANDGLIVFEANAAMRHNFDHAGNFSYTEPHLQRISRAFEDMIQKRALHSE